MSLHLVTGTAGSGKTTYLYNETIRMAGNDPPTTYYFIVPEQFSIKTQYDLVLAHPDGGIMNIDVTSLARLAHKAFSVLSGEKHEFLPEIGKSMIIKKVLSDHKDELQIYGRNARRAGFVADAKALVSELFQYGVEEKALEEVIRASSDRPLFQKKMTDALTVFRGFKEHLTGGLMTGEGLYDAFAEIAERSGILKDSVILMDGFTGFTPSQYELLRCFMRQCREVYISFTADRTALSGKEMKDYELFRISQISIKKVRELAAEAGCDEAEPVICEHDKFSEAPGLKALEKNIFGHSRIRQSAFGNIVLYNAENAREEARYAAMQVEMLLREGGYRYRDIAIVLSDTERYGELVARELERINVRYFLDRKKSLGENECAGLIATVLRLMEKGADTELLLSFAKNGLSGFDKREVCILENYCLALGIKGSRFKRPFDRDFVSASGLVITAEEVNRTRAALMSTLSRVTGVKKSSALSLNSRVTGLFEKIGLEEKLQRLSEEFTAANDRLRAMEYSRVYEAVTEIFVQLDMFLGDEVMSAGEYREVIEAGLSEARVGLVPRGNEQILVGDIERTRLKDIKVLFLLGASDGSLPKPGSSGGILSERDKGRLEEFGVELSPGMLKKIGRDRFYLYLALTRPDHKLFVTFPGADENGMQLKPSQIVPKIKNLYTDVSVITKKDLPEVQRVLSDDLGHEQFLREERDKNVKELATAPYKREMLTEETAAKLYGERLQGSISKLETFSNCPFKFFLTYGLQIRVRDEFELGNADFGNVAHDALEHYGKLLRDEGLQWTDVDESRMDAFVERASRETLETYKEGIFTSSDKNAYIAERVRELVGVTVRALTRQLEGSDFEPLAFEQSFKVEGENYSLRGKIDRIDICTTGSKSVKVIDYKSSEHELNITDTYYGLSLQLPVYLKPATELAGDNARPAAMLYEQIQNPIVEDRSPMDLDSEEAVEEAKKDIFKEFKTKGIVNSDLEIIKHLDHSFIDDEAAIKKSVTSVKIPVATIDPAKGNGFFSAFSHVATDKEMKTICDLAYSKIKTRSEEIMKGNVAVTPVRKKDGLVPCRYCDYAAVCGFDEKNGDRSKSIREYKNDEIFERLKRAETEESNG